MARRRHGTRAQQHGSKRWSGGPCGVLPAKNGWLSRLIERVAPVRKKYGLCGPLSACLRVCPGPKMCGECFPRLSETICGSVVCLGSVVKTTLLDPTTHNWAPNHVRGLETILDATFGDQLEVILGTRAGGRFGRAGSIRTHHIVSFCVFQIPRPPSHLNPGSPSDARRRAALRPSRAASRSQT